MNRPAPLPLTRIAASLLTLGALLPLAGCGGGNAGAPLLPTPPSVPTQHALTLQIGGVGRIDSVPEGGFACTATCRVEFVSIATLSLRATPAAGQVFSGWKGACSGTAPTCEVVLSRDLDVGATFSPAAQASWDTERPVSAAGADEPKLAVDNQGRALMVWQQLEPGSADRRLFASQSGSDGWSSPVRLDTGAGDVAGTRLVLEPQSGRGLLLWRQLSPALDLWARPYDPASGWGAATRLENLPGAVGVADAGLDAQGNAVVVWEQVGPATRFSIYGARRSALDGAWSAPVLLETNESVGVQDGDPVVAVAPAGDAIAVWKRSDGVSGRLWGNRLAATGSWGTATEIVSDAGVSRTIGPHALARDASGNGMLVWSQADITNGTAASTVWFKRFAANQWVSESTTVAPQEILRQGLLSRPVLAMNRAGTAVVAWRREDNSVMAASAPPSAQNFGAAWAVVRPATSLPLNAQPALGLDATGQAWLAWTDRDLWLSRWTTGTGWSPAALHEAQVGEAGAPALASSEGGEAVIAWRQFISGEGTRVLARRYRSAP